MAASISAILDLISLVKYRKATFYAVATSNKPVTFNTAMAMVRGLAAQCEVGRTRARTRVDGTWRWNSAAWG